MTQRLDKTIIGVFKNHQVHKDVETWTKKLREERPQNYRELPYEARFAILHIQFLVRALKWRLRAMDPFFANKEVLNSIHNHLDELNGHWSQFFQQPNQYWKNIEGFARRFSAEVEKIPPRQGSDLWHEAFVDFTTEIEDALERAESTVSALASKAEETTEKLRVSNDEMDSFRNEIQTQKSRLDDMINQQTETFGISEQERANQFTAAEKKRSDQVQAFKDEQRTLMAEMIEEKENDFSEALRKSEEASSKSIDGINAQLKKAEEIVGTIVKTAMSGNYQIVANREYTNAWIMRGVAIASFFAMGAMVVWAVAGMHTSSDGLQWHAIFFRLSIGFAFLIPGFYCAKESARHWSAEKHNRRLSLELAGLDSFLYKLDEAERRMVLKEKANEYFGRGSAQPESGDAADLKDVRIRGDQIFKLAEQIAKIVRG
jgi:hypothetical protein